MNAVLTSVALLTSLIFTAAHEGDKQVRVELSKQETTSAVGLYGLAGFLYQSGQGSLVSIDSGTGGQSLTCQASSRNMMIGPNLQCYDNVNKIYYFIYESEHSSGFSTYLDGYNMSDANNITRISNGPIKLDSYVFSNVEAGVAYACVGDPNTGDIYIFGQSSNSSVGQILLRLSRVNSTFLNISIVNEYRNLNTNELTAVASGNCTLYDSKRNAIWVTAMNSKINKQYWYYIDAKTGVILGNKTFSEFGMYSCAYDELDDKIIGLEPDGVDAYSANSSQFLFKAVDPVTLQVESNFTPFKDEFNNWLSVFTFDAGNRIFYQILTKFDASKQEDDYPYIVSVNATNGQVIQSAKMGDAAWWNSPWAIMYVS